jgi:predicted aldo/keto reductase-like oxidoreductase
MVSKASDRPDEGNRRQFMKSTGVVSGAAALAASEPVWAGAPGPQPAVPTVTLGKTGQKVSSLGMGTSWSLSPSFVQAAIFSGVRYIDTSENYENTLCEKVLGEVLERTKMRKEVYLVTKNGRGKVGGPKAYATFDARLSASLERLKTDYVDCYYLHGIGGREIPLLSDPDVKAAFEKLKKQGKIKFCGLSCHDKQLPEIIEAAAASGFIDQIMIQYNYRTMNIDVIRRALDAASKANLGIVAMKTQGGAGAFQEGKGADSFTQFVDKGFKKEQAAIKAVLADHRVHVVVSEMTNRDMLRENMAAVNGVALSAREIENLEKYRLATAHLYCHGCGQHCEPSAGGVAVADIMRFLRYEEVYGKRQRARELFQELTPRARDIVSADLAAVEAACPHGLPVADLLRRAEQRLS